MTLCIWPVWRLHLGHLTPLAASMVYDDSGRPWCFPDGSRSGHAITALQLGNVTRGDEVAAEKEAVWLWIWSVLYLNPKIEQIHTHISTHTYKINIIHTHTTPQLQGVFLGTSCGIPPNIYFLSRSPILSPVYLPSHHSLFLRSPSYFLIITFNAQGVPINPDAQSKALWDRGRDPKSFSRVSRFASFSPRSAERPISGPGFWGEPDPQQLPHHWCYNTTLRGAFSFIKAHAGINLVLITAALITRPSFHQQTVYCDDRGSRERVWALALDRRGFKFQLQRLIAGWPWASHLASLSLRFLIYVVGIK